MTRQEHAVDTETKQSELIAPDIGTTDVPKEHFHLLVGILFLLVGALWLLPLGTSLWLDETGTFWIVDGSFWQTIHRALESSGSIPYYVVVWLAKTIGGTSEVVLRLPSIVALGVATYLLFCLGRRLFDRETGVLAAILFVASGRIVFAAADARPYAMALMALIASFFFLVRWMDEGRPLDAVLYVAFSALTIATHYLIGLALLAQVPYAVTRRRRMSPVATRHLVAAWGAIALLALPVLPNVIDLWRTRASHAGSSGLTAGTVVHFLVPSAVVVAVLIAFLAGQWLGPLRFKLERGTSSAGLLLWTWFLSSPVLLFLLSIVSVQLLWARYFLPSVAAASLLIGWAIRSISPYRLRQVAVGVFALLSIAQLISTQHVSRSEGFGLDHWREAAAAEQTVAQSATTPVLVRGGYSEADDTSLFADPETRSELLSPLAAYPMKGSIVPLPSDFGRSAERYLETVVSHRGLTNSPQILLVTLGSSSPFQIWLDATLRPYGYTSHEVGMYGDLVLIEYLPGGA
jgi:4-amino-4-deoxy-L-arabinose transferase-like glycosyltransferase